MSVARRRRRARRRCALPAGSIRSAHRTRSHSLVCACAVPYRSPLIYAIAPLALPQADTTWLWALEPDARHLDRPRLAFFAPDVDGTGGEELTDHGGVGEEVLGDG